MTIDFTRTVIAALTMTTGTAFAAVPSNDTYDGSVAVEIPYSQMVDTSGATSDAVDEELNAGCGAPATDASVYFTVTAPGDMPLTVDVSGSSYSAGVIVATGSPGSFEPVWCGPASVSFDAAAGVTYTILVFDDQLDGQGNGGTLALDISRTTEPVIHGVTVDPTGKFNSRTGTVTLSGTMTCSDAVFAGVDASVTQNAGRFTVAGEGWSSVDCDGTPRPWTIVVIPFNGKFAGGKAIEATLALACGQRICTEEYAVHRVLLKGK